MQRRRLGPDLTLTGRPLPERYPAPMITARTTLLAALLLTPAWPTAALVQQAKLLDVPQGWSHERLAFPLDFAPELDYAGFEDLAFAPGMFDPASDSHWSYALAIRLEELSPETRIDDELLEQFLQAYYLGLCRAVAGSRGLDVDLDAIATEVVFTGAGWSATIELFDVFADGAPLSLALELAAQRTPTTIELLGIASPKPDDAPIWTELRRVLSHARARWGLTAALNHVYAVVDAETYATLVAEPALRELAVCEQRETVRGDRSYTGFYMYGHETYFEFLRADPELGLELGGVGIALGVEVPGDLEALGAALSAAEITTFASPEPVTRELDGEPVPWFEILGIQAAHAQSRAQVFAMEYVPDFLADWHADLAPQRDLEAAGVGLARRDVLERYAASLDQSALRERAPLSDVVGVELALDERERAYYSRVLTALGYAQQHEAGSDFALLGPGVRLGAAPPGILLRLELALPGENTARLISCGQVSLEIDGRRATLSVCSAPAGESDSPTPAEER